MELVGSLSLLDHIKKETDLAKAILSVGSDSNYNQLRDNILKINKVLIDSGIKENNNVTNLICVQLPLLLFPEL